MNMIIAENYEDLSCRTAERIADYIKIHPNSLLCLAAGHTPLGTLKRLLEIQQEGRVNLSAVFYAGLDEWVGLGASDQGSCCEVMSHAFYLPAGIPEDHIHLFDGMDADTDLQCRKMEDWITSHGGIGLTLLGVGMNGHIGFNEPNGPNRDGCFTVVLDEITKSVSVKYFKRPLPVEYGITVGTTLLKRAENVFIIADGKRKAEIVHQAFCEPISANVPASLMQGHPGLVLLLDSGAASKI